MTITMVASYWPTMGDMIVYLLFANVLLVYVVVGGYKINKLLNAVYHLLKAYANL